MLKLNQKNVVPSSTHCSRPNMMVVTPVTKEPPRNKGRDPSLAKFLPKSGEKIMVTTKTELNT